MLGIHISNMCNENIKKKYLKMSSALFSIVLNLEKNHF